MASSEMTYLQNHYQALLNCSRGSQNSIWLAQIIASWQAGIGTLPDRLGLEQTQFNRLRSLCFPGYPLDKQAISGRQSDFSRMLEKQDLESLLRRHANQTGEETEWLITLLVTACLGSDHLWQDLGLWSRQELSNLIRHNFPGLATANSKDMKWKKFLYKQLCEAEGLYVCRAPSCEVCLDYEHCFGPEI
jgi:nitrogen fixation protein NifQ